jgi:hypothetical protein
VTILKLSVMVIEPSQAVEHGLDLIREIALRQFPPYGNIELGVRGALLFGN